MNSTPLLSTCNHFEILSNIHDSKTTLPDVQNPKEIPFPIPVPAPNPEPARTPEIPRIHKLKWQKTLPKTLIIASAKEISTSLKLKVEIETTDTAEKKSVTTLLDSGSTGECIDRDYAKSCRFNLVKLAQLILVYNVDRTPNEAGSITEVVSLILRYKNHSERTCQGTSLTVCVEYIRVSSCIPFLSFFFCYLSSYCLLSCAVTDYVIGNICSDKLI